MNEICVVLVSLLAVSGWTKQDFVNASEEMLRTRPKQKYRTKNAASKYLFKFFTSENVVSIHQSFAEAAHESSKELQFDFDTSQQRSSKDIARLELQ
jgi:hypothetical protein